MKKNSIVFVLTSVILSFLTILTIPFTHLSAETSNSFKGFWLVWEVTEQLSTTQWRSYQNVVITTNDPTCIGSVSVTNTSNAPNSFTYTAHFAGTYTYYDHLNEQYFTVSNGLLPTYKSNFNSFTSVGSSGSHSNIEVTQLSSTQLDQIINAINSISVSGGGSSYDDTDLMTLLGVINGVLDNIDDNTGATTTQITSLNTTATSILNALNGIDNAIDTISWNNVDITYLGASNDGTNFNLSQQQYTNDYKFYTDNYTISTNADCIYYLRLPIYLDYGKTFQLGRSNNNSYYNVLYVIYGRNYTDIFFIPSENRQHNNLWNGNAKFILTVSGGQVYQYTASSNNNRFFLKTLPSSDIEYWQLKSFFLQAQSQQTDTSAIDNENDNLTNTVDDYIDTEDTLIGGFESAISNNAVDPSVSVNTNPSNWGSTFLSSIALVGQLFNYLTFQNGIGNPIYLMINFSLMFGLALLVIGKRG